MDYFGHFLNLNKILKNAFLQMQGSCNHVGFPNVYTISQFVESSRMHENNKITWTVIYIFSQKLCLYDFFTK